MQWHFIIAFLIIVWKQEWKSYSFTNCDIHFTTETTVPCENISAQIITSAKKEDAKKSSLHQYFAPNLISKVLDG